MDSLLKIAIEQIPDPVDPDEMLPVRNQLLVNFERHGFIEGANYMKQELLRWRDPKKELPDKKQYDWVLIKIRGCDGFIGLPHIGELRSDGYWHCADYDDLFKLGESFEERLNCEVIGWRPINEL